MNSRNATTTGMTTMGKQVHDATIDTPPEGLPVWAAAERLQATNKCNCYIGGKPELWVNKQVAYTIGKPGDSVRVPLYTLGVELKGHYWMFHFRAAEDTDLDTTFVVDLGKKTPAPEKVPVAIPTEES